MVVVIGIVVDKLLARMAVDKGLLLLFILRLFTLMRMFLFTPMRMFLFTLMRMLLILTQLRLWKRGGGVEK